MTVKLEKILRRWAAGFVGELYKRNLPVTREVVSEGFAHILGEVVAAEFSDVDPDQAQRTMATLADDFAVEAIRTWDRVNAGPIQ